MWDRNAVRTGRAASALLIALALVAAACGGGNSGGHGNETSKGSLTIEGVKANDHGTKDASGEGSFELEADNDGSENYFSPTVITASPGQSIRLTVKNEGSTEHNLTIESLGINKDLEPGKEATVTVKLPQSGVLTFHCEYHKSVGMVGEFRVS